MFVKINSFAVLGIDCVSVDAEVDISTGHLPSFEIVGLPDAAVKEARDRVRAALKNSKFSLPTAKITVNLAPANIKKVGSVYDLPIFLGILLASSQLRADLSSFAFAGELSLGGEIKPVPGILPMALKAREKGMNKFFVPFENSLEASIAEGIEIIPLKNAKELIEYLREDKTISPMPKFSPPDIVNSYPDFCDVKGQYQAKRGLEIAAAGNHNALMLGPPGSGKSMMAKRLPGILPKMTYEEQIESTKIYSVAGITSNEHPLVLRRPFRSPHHTISPAGLAGGGINPRPGEISLSHRGVLFLDELPEFQKRAMEILRQPLEDNKVTISRANGTISYPSSFMLIGAMNPCPCGYFGDGTGRCKCSATAVKKYLSKISGPLLDRIDLHLEVSAVKYEEISNKKKSESSEEIRKRVEAAREIQAERFKDLPIFSNAQMESRDISRFCVLTPDAEKTLKNAFDNLHLSARGYDKIIKVARTIADLDSSESISEIHLLEAISYRNLDKKYFNFTNEFGSTPF